MSLQEMRSQVAFTATASGLAAVVVLAWVSAGVALPQPASEPVQASPMARLLDYALAIDLGLLAQGVAWSIAANILLAAGLALMLLLKAGRKPAARQLGQSLAMGAAGFSILLMVLSLPPFEPMLFEWLALLVPGESAAALTSLRGLTAATGFALIGGSSWLLIRFWCLHLGGTDDVAFHDFVRARIARPDRERFERSWRAGHAASAALRQLRRRHHAAPEGARPPPTPRPTERCRGRFGVCGGAGGAADAPKRIRQVDPAVDRALHRCLVGCFVVAATDPGGRTHADLRGGGPDLCGESDVGGVQGCGTSGRLPPQPRNSRNANPAGMVECCGSFRTVPRHPGVATHDLLLHPLEGSGSR